MRQQLEEVLEAYAASDPGPSRTVLSKWIAQHPEFARELTAFTARWQLLDWTADVEPASEVTSVGLHAADGADEDERLILRGMSAAQAVFYGALARRQAAHDAARVGEGATPIADAAPSAPLTTPPNGGAAAPVDAPIPSLLRQAQRVGLVGDALAERVGLSSVLLRKLDRRLIAAASIPVRVLADIAGALGRSVAAVNAYLRLAPAFAAGAQHRANQAPTLPTTREDFFEAVRKDLTLDEDRRRALLALPRPDATPTAGGPHGAAQE